MFAQSCVPVAEWFRAPADGYLMCPGSSQAIGEAGNQGDVASLQWLQANASLISEANATCNILQ